MAGRTMRRAGHHAKTPADAGSAGAGTGTGRRTGQDSSASRLAEARRVEERDAQRLGRFTGLRSLLNPLWYGGSLAIGMLAARFGDRANLGFLAETERQVEAHLKGHLTRLPEQDLRSRDIVEQMKADEVAHAETALQLGGVELPASVKAAMKASSRLMTGVAYWV